MSAQSAVAQITPKEPLMHVYVSIPALSHKVFKYAGYQSNDTNEHNQWHREKGVTGTSEEIVAGPYRVMVTYEYLGDRITEWGEAYGEPEDYVPKQFVVTKRREDRIICDLWIARSVYGDDERCRARAINAGGMLHCFQIKLECALNLAVQRHEEIERAQVGLEERVANWRKS